MRLKDKLATNGLPGFRKTFIMIIKRDAKIRLWSWDILIRKLVKGESKMNSPAF